MSSNLKLQFIIQAVDRATAPVRAISRQVERMSAPVRMVQRHWDALGTNMRLQGALGALIAAAAPIAAWGRTAAGALLAVGTAATGAALAMNRVVGRVSAVADQAIKLGMTTEEFTRLTFAARQAGASEEAMSTGLMHLMQNMQEARDGSKEASMWLARVGITMQDLRKGMTAGQAFERIAETFARVGDTGDNAQKKIAAMRAVMGRGGAELIQLANGGAKGLREMATEADRTGNTLSGESAAAMKDYGDLTDKLSGSIFGLAARITTSALPAMKATADRLLAMSVAAQGGGWADRVGLAVGRLVSRLPDLLNLLMDLAEAVWGVARFVNGLVQAIGGWNTVLAVLVGVIAGNALFALYSLATALWAVAAAFLATPFGPVIAGIALLVAGAALLRKYWEPIAGFFERIAAAFGKVTNRPAQGAPSIYASADEWKRYRESQGKTTPSAIASGSAAPLGGTLRIEVAGEAKVRELKKSPGSPLDLDVYSGLSMAGG